MRHRNLLMQLYANNTNTCISIKRFNAFILATEAILASVDQTAWIDAKLKEVIRSISDCNTHEQDITTLEQGKEEVMRLRAAIAKFLEEQDAAAKLQATARMTQAADKVHEHRCMNTYVAVGYQCIRTSPPVDFSPYIFLGY